MDPEAHAAVPAPALWRGTRSAPSDLQLVDAAREGSLAAADQLVRRHWPECHRSAYLIVRDAQLAEDVAQEAMLSSLRALDSFDRRRPFRAWLHRIAINEALDAVRARSRRPEHELQAENIAFAATEVSPQSLDISRALSKLDAESRAIVVCRHLLGYKPREIARLLGLPAPTVRTKLRRALEALRPRLTNYSEDH